VALAVAEAKAGTRIACPKCQAVNKIPGIAMQSQATKEQIEQLQIAFSRHRQSLWAILVLLVVVTGIPLFYAGTASTMSSDGEGLLGMGILIAIILAILVPILKSCEYLGASKSINVLLFVFLFPVWAVWSIILYKELKTRLSNLKEAGIRSEET
jgi:uncharacterized membrane protein